jgi:hypothetical protein
MNHAFGLLTALGITLVGFLLLLWGPYMVSVALVRIDRNLGMKDLGCTEIPTATLFALFLALFVFAVLLVLGVLHLPPSWRLCAAAVAAVLVIGGYR